MSISKKDVTHIADLARIELTEEETTKFEKELSGILAFVKELDQVDTTGIEPMAGGTALENATRPDEPRSRALEGKEAALRDTTPAKKGDLIEVKAIFD